MNANNRISCKEDSIRYKKVGNRYVQITDPYAYEGLSNGWWLVKVSPTSKTIRAIVHPNNAEITAAALDKADQLMDIIQAAGAAAPRDGHSPEALVDWEAFMDKHGSEFNYISYPSLHDVATKIIDNLIKS